MNKEVLPQAREWNHYWDLDQTEKFTRVSWSKKRIMNILEPYTVRRGRALDAGCGSGFFSKFLCDQGMQTVSLDYSDSALEIAQRLTAGRAQLIKRSLLADDLQKDFSEPFDLIFTDGLFEHFIAQDQDRIMQNLRSVLPPQGVIVTFVPNRWSPWELIRPMFMPGIEETPFVLSQLTDLNLRNGLTINKKGGINTFPFAISPDQVVGNIFGMLLYTISGKK